MDLTLNYTLIIQIVLFLVLYLCLKPLLFDPMTRVLADREQRTTGTRAEAETLRAEADEARARHADAIHAARVEIAQRLEASRREAQEEYDRNVAAARAAAAAEGARQREALALQVDGVRRTLAGEVDDIAGEMLQRLSGGAAS